jgi:hypothetical protein
MIRTMQDAWLFNNARRLIDYLRKGHVLKITALTEIL